MSDMRQSFFASLIALCGLGCPDCSSVDVYGAFVSVAVQDAGLPDLGSDASAQGTAGIAGALAPPHVGESKPANSQPVAATTPGETRVSEIDAGAVVAAPSRDDLLCLRKLAQDGACESARKLAFGRAVCSCGDIVGTGLLSTQSSTPAAGRADVGADSSLSLRIGRRGAVDDAPGEIDGSIVVAGPGPSALSGSNASIRGDVLLAGELTFAGDVHVAGSLSARRMPRGNGTLSIDGDLRYAMDRLPIDPPSNLQVAGSVVESDYTFEAPCECNPANLAELPRAIAAAESSNDDALLQLAPDSMSNLTSDRGFALSCGQYYFLSVSSLASITWQISGHVVVHVAGDFAVRGELKVTLAPDAELDVLVGGSLLLSSSASFGDPARPAASRIYVQAAVELETDVPAPGATASDAMFVGNLFAPAASLQLAPHSEVYGSLFVRQLLVLQSLLVHYDPAVISERGAHCEK
jgi:hypothetical protein